MYKDLLENTKDRVIGYFPLTPHLLTCSLEHRKLTMDVVEEWYKKL